MAINGNSNETYCCYYKIPPWDNLLLTIRYTIIRYSRKCLTNNVDVNYLGSIRISTLFLKGW